MAGDAIPGAREIFALLDPQSLRRLRVQGAGQDQRDGREHRGNSQSRAPRQLWRMAHGRPLQSSSLPHGSGMGRLPFGTGEGSAGTGSDARYAATAATSASVRSPATTCIQSGSGAVRVP